MRRLTFQNEDRLKQAFIGRLRKICLKIGINLSVDRSPGVGVGVYRERYVYITLVMLSRRYETYLSLRNRLGGIDDTEVI